MVGHGQEQARGEGRDERTFGTGERCAFELSRAGSAGQVAPAPTGLEDAARSPNDRDFDRGGLRWLLAGLTDELQHAGVLVSLASGRRFRS